MSGLSKKFSSWIYNWHKAHTVYSLSNEVKATVLQSIACSEICSLTLWSVFGLSSNTPSIKKKSYIIILPGFHHKSLVDSFLNFCVKYRRMVGSNSGYHGKIIILLMVQPPLSSLSSLLIINTLLFNTTGNWSISAENWHFLSRVGDRSFIVGGVTLQKGWYTMRVICVWVWYSQIRLKWRLYLWANENLCVFCN